ncbi:MAG TPA: lipopolysaccharide assembly protein LapA domain-containing protein [Pseudolabrys sp.]|nr:lipopolysaccharide assembly protein LapA domain-containing protein [Pseudolabrys sp.]
MFRKIVTAIIVVPLAAVIVAFAVANRQTVTVSFDPFSSASPAYAVTLPLFAVILLVLIVGVLVGGCAAWLRQGKWRRGARRFEGEVRALHSEMDAFRRRFGTTEKPPVPVEPSPLVIPPPVP